MWWEEACDQNCLIQYPGSDIAVLFDWRGEDSGPNVNSADDVLKLYAQARAKFPNATVRSAGLDDIAESLLRPEVRSKLPVLDLEVGDTVSGHAEALNECWLQMQCPFKSCLMFLGLTHNCVLRVSVGLWDTIGPSQGCKRARRDSASRRVRSC